MVGRSTERTMKKLGICTIGDLAGAEPSILETYLGKMGLVLHTFANGWDETPVLVEGYKVPIKSIGNSTTTPRDLVSELDVKIILMALSESVGARLRENGFQCRTVEISIRDNGLYHFTRQCKLDRASNLTEEIARTAFELFQKTIIGNIQFVVLVFEDVIWYQKRCRISLIYLWMKRREKKSKRWTRW